MTNPSAAKGELKVKYGKREEDLFICNGDGTHRADVHLLFGALHSRVVEADFQTAFQLEMNGHMKPSILDQLEARGYDPKSLEMSIRKKADAQEVQSAKGPETPVFSVSEVQDLVSVTKDLALALKEAQEQLMNTVHSIDDEDYIGKPTANHNVDVVGHFEPFHKLMLERAFSAAEKAGETLQQLDLPEAFKPFFKNALAEGPKASLRYEFTELDEDWNEFLNEWSDPCEPAEQHAENLQAKIKKLDSTFSKIRNFLKGER